MSLAATWMELNILILSEVCQKEKDKYHMMHLYVKYKICRDDPSYKTETDQGHGEQTFGCKWEGQEGDGW